MSTTEDDILVQQRGHVVMVRLNRPHVLNALRQTTIERLIETLDATAAHETTRVVVLTGTGRAFSAGIDLKELGEQAQDPLDPGVRNRLERTQDLTRRLIRHPKIVVAAVNGLAVGMGAELCVATDLRVASETATFAFPEVKRALFETNGVTLLLPRIVGLGKALQWLLTGETVSAREAHTAGLVNYVVPPERVVDAAVEIANGIAVNAPLSVRLLKRLVHDAYDTDLARVLRDEVDGVLTCMRSEDYREGISAFTEKRAPSYRGR